MIVVVLKITVGVATSDVCASTGIQATVLWEGIGVVDREDATVWPGYSSFMYCHSCALHTSGMLRFIHTDGHN